MDVKPLPNDLEACHRLIANLQSEVDSHVTEVAFKDKLIEEQAHSVLELKGDKDRLDEQVTELNLTIEKLLNQLYGRKSERRIDGVGQLLLDLGEEPTPEVVSALEEAIRDAEQIVDDAEEAKKQRRAKRPRKDDRKFPEHFPRYERIVDLPEERREGLKLVGYDEVETLELIRSEVRVRVTKYAKYAHPVDKSQGIVSPDRPTGLVEGDRFDVSIGVEVVASKYFYHLPFYRQQDAFSCLGWTPSRSTLCNLETAVEFTLRPLSDYLHSYLKTDRTIGCDDTGVLLITPKTMPDLSNHPRRERIAEVLEAAIAQGKPSIKANFWGYYASRLPVVAFDFTVSRHRDGPDDVLGDFAGNLIGDCWSGFQKIDVRSDSRITFAACWAHARRKIDECRSAFPIQVAKLESLIRMLYDIEDQIKLLDDDQRLARRQSLSRHVLGLIEAYLNSEAMSSPAVLPKSNLGQAAAYVRRHWHGAESLRGRSDDSNRQQRLRTIDETHRHGPKELAVQRFGSRGRASCELDDNHRLGGSQRPGCDRLPRRHLATRVVRRHRLVRAISSQLETHSPRIHPHLSPRRASPSLRPQTPPPRPPPPAPQLVNTSPTTGAGVRLRRCKIKR